MGFFVDRVKQVICPRCGQPVPTTDAPPLSQVFCKSCRHKMTVPVMLGRDIRIDRMVGRGAGSIVYEATDLPQRRKIAVKVLQENAAPGLRQAGLAEAEALSKLDHPNLVKVYGVDTEHGLPCIFLELLTGGSLKTMLDASGMINPRLTLTIAINLASALHTTSSSGLLHLDIKPANVMFDRHGTPKLLDFGYVGLQFDPQSRDIPGTPYYVSPELVRRQPPGPQSDMYSLGATLFHLLSGHAPFEGRTIGELLKSRLEGPAPDLLAFNPRVPPDLARVVGWMMAPSPQDRPPDFATLLRELGRVQTGGA